MPKKPPRQLITDAAEVTRPVEDAGDRKRKRLEAIKQTAGSLIGVYGRDDLERLREDWPT